MAEQNRRSWLDKIGKWALDILPSEDGKHSEETDEYQTEQSITYQEAPSEKITHSQQGSDDKSPRLDIANTRITTKPAETSDSFVQPTQPDTEEISDRTLIKAWQAFEVAWENAGLGNNYFLKGEDLVNLLSLLDMSFEACRSMPSRSAPARPTLLTRR